MSLIKRAKAEQKSNDIIDWIVKHWPLFTATKQEMQDNYRQLGAQYPYTVDGLCDLLGLDNNIFFKKVKVVDTAVAFIRFERCPLFKLFTQCREAMKGKPVCLFAIAGESSLVITDMNTNYVNGLCHLFYRDQLGNDINIFKAEDAPQRLPGLFSHTTY